MLPAEDVAPISDASAPRTSQRTMARAVSWAWGGSLVSQLAGSDPSSSLERCFPRRASALSRSASHSRLLLR